MANSTEKQDRRNEALAWVGRQLRYESFLAALRTGGETVTPIGGRTVSPATDETRDTAAA